MIGGPAADRRASGDKRQKYQVEKEENIAEKKRLTDTTL